MVAFGAGALLHGHAAAGRAVGQVGGGHLDVAADLVGESEVGVDGARGDLAALDRADDRGRAPGAVAAGEEAGVVGDAGIGVGLQLVPLGGKAEVLEGARVDVLADGHDDGRCRDADGLGARRLGRGTPAAHGRDHLGLAPKRDGVAVLVDLDVVGGDELHELAAVLDRAVDLLVERGHVGATTTVDDLHRLGAHAHRAAGRVHRDVAAADHDDVLAGVVVDVPVADGAQHRDGGHDARGVFAVDAELLVGVGADADVDGVVVALEVLDRDVGADGDAELDVDAERGDERDLGVEQILGQAVVRDAVAEHAAELGALLVDGDRMSHARQEVGCGKAAGATADDGHALAGGLVDRAGALRLLMVARVALEAADVDSGVDEAATAGVLARMLAHVGAGRRERVVLADQVDGVVIATGLHERDVTGDVDVCGAALDAGHGVLGGHQAAAFLVQLVILVEGAHAGERHFCGLRADGAVSGDPHVFRQMLDRVQRLVGCRAVEHAVEQVLDLA